MADPRSRNRPGGVDLDPVRMALVDRLVREAHADRPDWLAAWQDAVDAASARTIGFLEARCREAARASRAPAEVVARAHPDADDRRLIRAWLDSAGIPLEEAVAAAEMAAGAATHYPRVGGAVEEGWLELERVVAAILAGWTPRIRAVHTWRRPRRVLWVVTGLLVGGAVVVGAMIGGYLPAPGWMASLISWWWGLPWP